MGKYKKLMPSSAKVPHSSQGTTALGTGILNLSQHSGVGLCSEKPINPSYPL